MPTQSESAHLAMLQIRQMTITRVQIITTIIIMAVVRHIVTEVVMTLIPALLMETPLTKAKSWLDALPAEVRSWPDGSEDGNTGFANYHSSIGAYTICQATNELELLYTTPKSSLLGSTPICLIPTNTRNGYTTYIGDPQCFPSI